MEQNGIDEQDNLNHQNQGCIAANKPIIKQLVKDGPISLTCGVLAIIMYLVSIGINFYFTKTFNGLVFSSNTLIYLGANSYTYVFVNHEYYRLIMAVFLHGGLLHLVINMSSVFTVLISTQKIVSKRIFYTCFFIGGIQGNMLTDLVSRFRNSSVISIGMSTSICAIIGLSLAINLFQAIRNQNAKQGVKQLICVVIYIGIISLLPQVDFYGHMGSLLSGTLLGMSLLSNTDNNSIQSVSSFAKLIWIIYSFILMISFLPHF